MNSDIKLNGPNVQIEATHIDTNAHDLILNNAGRRKKGKGGTRRALVHGFQDELVINFHADYPGGTVVHGNLNVLGSDHKRRLAFNPRWGNLTLGGEGGDGDIFFLDRNNKETLRIGGDEATIRFENKPNWPRWPGEKASNRLDLMKELKRMKEEILALREEVDQLKK